MLWLRMLFTRTYRGFTGICELRFEHEMLLHREMLGGFAHVCCERAKFKFCTFFTWSHVATLSQLMMTPNYLILLIDTIIIHRNTHF